MTPSRLAAVSMLVLASALAAGCATVSLESHTTRVESTWKDPRYAAPPMRKVFVVSLMKVEPGGRNAVEDAIAARLEAAGVTAVTSHTVMSADADKPGPSLAEAIKASGADGVLLVQVKSIGSKEPYTVGETVTSLSPDTLAYYDTLKRDGWNQPGDYKIAHVVSELYLSPMGRQVWTAYTSSYDANNLARNIPDYTLKLVAAMAKDRMIAAAPKPAS
jgi:hypothetical protein